jgi:hypothetical protein
VGNKYVYNKHIAPITANVRDDRGTVVYTKTFMPEHIDGTTGLVTSTGYTTLTDEQYEDLCKSSRTFVHYKDKLKLLVMRDDLPPDAKTPQEALADARRNERQAQGRISELEKEVAALRWKLVETEGAYKILVSASTDLEKVKPLLDAVDGFIGAFDKAGKDAKASDLGALASALKGAAGVFRSGPEKKGGVKGKDFD